VSVAFLTFFFLTGSGESVSAEEMLLLTFFTFSFLGLSSPVELELPVESLAEPTRSSVELADLLRGRSFFFFSGEVEPTAGLGGAGVACTDSGSSGIDRSDVFVA